MCYLFLFTFIFILPGCFANADTLQTERFCFSGDSLCITGVLERPSKKGIYPAVVVLHGAAGLDQRYVRLCENLADSHFVALALDYYAVVGASPIRSEEKLQKWPSYQTAVRNAIRYLQTLPVVSKQSIGLVGFSRGAFLAVSVAASLPSVKAVVDFYGGGGGGTEPLEKEVPGFPPLLILHGEKDSIVPVRFAYALEEAVIHSGGEVELHIFAGEKHGLSEASFPDAFRRMFRFLREHLKK